MQTRGMAWFPDLIRLNEELRTIVARAMSPWQFGPDRPEKPVIAFFTGKAYKTHKSILMLASEGFGEDAAILTRSLLNLVINALWLNQDWEARLPAFIEHDWVQRAKLGRKFIANPRLLGADSDERLVQIQNTQPQIEAEERRAKQRYKYKGSNWSSKTIRDMAKDVGLLDAYDTAYGLLSNLVHSNARSANDYVTESTEGFNVDVEPNPNYVRESLLTAHHLLLRMVTLANDVLELGIVSEVEGAKRREQAVAVNAQPSQ